MASLSLKSSVGNQWSCWTPLGIDMKAIRKGAPLAVVAPFVTAARAALADRATSEGSAGRAIETPNPRRKRRRLMANARSWARLARGVMAGFLVTGVALFLQRSRLDYALHQGAELAAAGRQAIDDQIDGVLVVIVQ